MHGELFFSKTCFENVSNIDTENNKLKQSYMVGFSKTQVSGQSNNYLV